MRSGTIFARGAATLLLGLALGGPAPAQYLRWPNEPEADFGVTHIIQWLEYANAFCGAAKGKLANATVTWTGACRDGRLEGPGTLHIAQGYMQGGRGITFTGTFARGFAEGPAQVAFDGGLLKSFAGVFHDNLPNGPGIVAETAGRRIAGDYAYDSPTGRITVDYIDGAQAQFTLGGPPDAATLRFADGTIERFADGSGFTRVIYPDGSLLTARLGDAVYCGAHGTRYAGTMVWARPDSSQSLTTYYPDIARRLNEQGIVEISLLVGRDGSKTAVALHRSTGSDRLDNAALASVTNWRYLPATVDGHPIPMSLVVGITFDLHPHYEEGDSPLTVLTATPEDERRSRQQRRWIRKSCAALR